jgi:ribonuclease HII
MECWKRWFPLLKRCGMSNRPMTREVTSGQRRSLRELLESRGHALRKNAKNKYLEFEVRTDAKSIFTLYTSGKLVSTVREGDSEGLILEDEISRLVGKAGVSTGEKKKVPKDVGANASSGILNFAGVDETGTGELLGTAILAGALFPRAIQDRVQGLVGHVETKAKRAASGWERLGHQMADLRVDGLALSALSLPNRLFDRYSKNALLDFAYVRVVGDLIAASGRNPEGALDDMELAIDDYGTGPFLKEAVAAWRARGLTVRIETKADDNYLAARAASVLARATRAREMSGLQADEIDGPLGTGNAGHRDTLAWLRRRARSNAGWPSFVKTSFRTVTEIDRVEAVTKEPVPPVSDLLDPDSAREFVEGRLNVKNAQVRTGGTRFSSRLEVDASSSTARSRSFEFLPLLCGGVVLDETISLELLDELLDRETGFLSGWRILVGKDSDIDDPFFLSLARAHARGVVQVVPTEQVDPLRRAAERAGLQLMAPGGDSEGLHAVLNKA